MTAILERPDCIVIGEDLLERSNIAAGERVLVVDETNGARSDLRVKGPEGSGEIVVSGASHHVHPGDEVVVTAFAWSERPSGLFRNILVDDENRFVRYLTEGHGDTV